MQRPMRRGPARLGATQAPMRGSLAPQCRSCARAWVDTVLQRSAATTSRGRRAACCRANGAVRGGSTPRGYAADNATRRAASRPALPPRCRTPARSPAARTNPYAAAYRAAWPPARQGGLARSRPIQRSPRRTASRPCCGVPRAATSGGGRVGPKDGGPGKRAIGASRAQTGHPATERRARREPSRTRSARRRAERSRETPQRGRDARNHAPHAGTTPVGR
jgi:hypothetical protein